MVFVSFFLIWGGTCSLRMPALRPASQAGPMRNPKEGTVAPYHQANLMVCVVVARPLLIERCVGQREGSGV